MAGKKTNSHLVAVVRKLKEASKAHKAAIWKTVAEALEAPAQNLAEVNISKLDSLAKDNKIFLVPGKLLGAGTLAQPVEVYAYAVSESAKKSIHSAKGKIGAIEDLIAKNPKGTGVQLIK